MSVSEELLDKRLRAAATRQRLAAQMEQTRAQVQQPRAQQYHLKVRWRAANEQLATMRREYETQLLQERSRLQQRVFGPPSQGSADPIALQHSYRHALELAARAETVDDAGTLYARAEAVGDELLARAVAVIAYERGWEYLLQTYVSMRPDEAKALRELEAFDGEFCSDQVKAEVDRAFAELPRPPEIPEEEPPGPVQ